MAQARINTRSCIVFIAAFTIQTTLASLDSNYATQIEKLSAISIDNNSAHTVSLTNYANNDGVSTTFEILKAYLNTAPTLN